MSEFLPLMHKVCVQSIPFLPATALLSRVTEEDQKLLKTLLPRVRSLTQRCGQGLSCVVSAKTAISYWWGTHTCLFFFYCKIVIPWWLYFCAAEYESIFIPLSVFRFVMIPGRVRAVAHRGIVLAIFCECCNVNSQLDKNTIYNPWYWTFVL